MTTTLPPVSVKPLDGKNVEIKLRKVRLSFCDVFEAVQGSDDKGNPTDRFYLSTNILLDKETDAGKAQIAAVRQGLKEARTAEWGESPPSIGANCLCLQDGEPIDPNTLDDDGKGGTRKARWEGYAGHMYISANKPLKAKNKEEAAAELKEKNPVQILGPRKTAKDANGNPMFPILTEKDGLIYAGCYADVIIKIYPYNGTGKGGNGKNHPHRINASLEAIKFVEHGQAFGGKRINAQDEFDEETGDEDGDDATSGASESGSGGGSTASGDDFDALG